MKSGRMDPARKVRLQMEAVGQYIETIEKENEALKRDLVKAANGGLCDLCAHVQKPPMCFEADFDCAICKEKSCKCKTCTGACENFTYKGAGE